MSKVLINQYYTNLDRALQFGKSTNEQSIRNHFWNLLNDYARKQNYEVVTEVSCQGTKGVKVRPDGIVKNLFGLDIGLWESKDEKDSIDDEIDVKLKKGYPFTNILFEDTQVAVLFQRGEEILRVSVRDADKLHAIITEFISFKSETVFKFEDALEKFKADIPVIVETLRKRIDETRVKNKNFIVAAATFLELCKAEINPDITEADVREMMIQHILTSDIFNKIFDDPEFHRHNNIARELEKLIEILFTYSERKNLLGNIEHYYDAINSAAASITDHHEKQKFLKVLYENFYKVYNPKAADRLGVVYTPNEIVQFMIEGTDYLLEKHFGRTLADENVEILDPATGTGTFITSIIDRLPKQSLPYKYKNEIHANEVAILPYYVANLNIEFTFKQKMGYYEEFKNFCFVDTLDNTDALAYSGKQHSLFGLSSENTERIQRQNSKKISVIIGNPPYNANQKNYNDENANREYPSIDKRIKETYVRYSTAQKTKAYDMYSRFFRWSTDRINDEGIVCFISNNSFIRKDSFDGFRKTVLDDFSNIYIIDLVGDLRDDKEGNVFGIKVGVAISFLVKDKSNKSKSQIHYFKPNVTTKFEKIEFLVSNKLRNIENSFKRITPSPKNDWLNFSNSGFENLLLLYDKKSKDRLFQLSSNAVSTNRDEWTYDFNIHTLKAKIGHFISIYNQSIKSKNISNNIKWSETLMTYYKSNHELKFHETFCISLYRPYTKQFLYYDKKVCDRLTENHFAFLGHTLNLENSLIAISSGQRGNFGIIATNFIPNLDIFMPNGTKIISLYQYNENGERIDNITAWGLEQFINNYNDKKILKEDIFYYIYGVLHNPTYRRKYNLNLKHEYPRLPFFADFWKWAKWGKELMDLHINYEKAEPYLLKENTYTVKAEAKRQKEIFKVVEEPEAMYTHKPKVKVKLKADKETGIIEIDELTFLTGVPKIAWEYKLGNRSALEWVLDQYKEKKPKDRTIAEKFNTYRFTDYKEHVIDLLKRVCTVSVETMRIVGEMERLN